jgi:hypothetical protein
MIERWKKGSFRIPRQILTMHIPFMLIFNKAITPGFPRLLVVHHFDLLDRAVRLKLAPDLGLARVVVDPADEEGLEGVGGHAFGRRGVPECDFLLEFVSDLFFFLALLSFESGRNGEGILSLWFILGYYLSLRFTVIMVHYGSSLPLRFT